MGLKLTNLFSQRHHEHEIHIIENHGTERSHKLPNNMADHENNLYNSLTDRKELNTNSKGYEIVPSMEMITILHRQLEALRKLTAHSDDRRQLEDRMEEWKLVAKVLDRLLFVLFVCMQVGATVGVLLRISTADKFNHDGEGGINE